MKPTPFDQQLAKAALEMAQERTLPATVERAVTLVVDTIETCDAAAVALFDDGQPSTVVASDATLGDLVHEWARLGSSPAVTAFVGRAPVHCPDLTVDARWPEFTDVMTRTLGFRSLYALPLTAPQPVPPTATVNRPAEATGVAAGEPLGVLVAYGKTPDAFDTEDRATAGLLAAHATAALTAAVTAAVKQAQLQTALDSRTVIGQATGVVMERFGLDATDAFGVLRRLSQTENVKLRDIAARIVATGQVG